VAPLTGTIVAVSTPPGPAPRALIRLSGPDAFPAINTLLAAPLPRARDLAAVALRIGQHALPCLVLTFPGPASFTGEDTVELLLPGGPAILRRVVDLLLGTGLAHPAAPGEFTARAYLAGRMTLAQAEGIGAIINAASSAELTLARRVLAGETGLLITAWCDEVATLLALTEAGIDFTDQEDVRAIEPDDLARRAAAVSDAARAMLGASRGTESADHAPRVVLAGPPNAGKSTLFNTLLGRPRATVSDRAGTTRDALSEPLDLSAVAPGAGEITLVDLAGLDEALSARSASDRASQAAALAAIDTADAVVWCDPRGRFDAAPARDNLIRVRTKADLPGDVPDAALCVCAFDGYNLGPLRRAIADLAFGRAAGGACAVPRHRRLLRSAAESLDDAVRAARSEASPELVAASLRAALDDLGEIIGRVTPDDVLGRIFATFCVGK
jgi:tRNA modification GTPase